jgi:hypothetical protein
LAAFTLAHRLHDAGRDLSIDAEIPPEPERLARPAERRRGGCAMKARRSGFVKLDHELMDSPAWRTASPPVRCLVLAIWRRHNGANNGTIPFGRREAQSDLGCGSMQATRYLRDAQDRGFIVPTRRGAFDWKSGARAATATTWRITIEPCNGRVPTNDWGDWVPPDESNRRVSERDHNGSRSETTYKTKSSYQAEPELAGR